MTTTIGFSSHDHASCVSDAVAQADAHCRAHGLQFTPQRRRVLEYLLEEHRAFGAYEILDRLRADGFSAQPPVAYRALEFLTRHGFAHRIERLNAFIACAHPDEAHQPAFLICRVCGAVAEADSPAGKGRLAEAARDAGFQIEETVIEAEGICPNCAGRAE